MAVDSIRGKAFKSSNRRTKIVTVEMSGEPTEIELIKPTIADRDTIIEIAGIGLDGKPRDIKSAMAAKTEALIRMACDPETHETLFNLKDRTQLKAQGVGSWVDELGGLCMDFMGEDKPAEEVAKN